MISIKVTFFASFKELLGCSSIDVELDNGAKIGDLCAILALKGNNWSDLFIQADKKVKIACNQQMAEMSTDLQADDEVAFFPPVTGG